MNVLRTPSGRWMNWGLLLAAAFLMAAGCSDTRSEAAAPEVLQPVRLVTVAKDDAETSRRLVGRFAPVRTLDLSFQVGGRIAAMPAQQGTLVPEGGLLAKLDTVDFELRLKQAHAELSLAEKTADRARRMLASQGGSRAALDEAETAVDFASATLDLARQQLAYSRIQAPFDALVTRRLQEQHANVDAFAPVIRVQDVTELRVHIDLPEALLPLIAAPEDFRIQAVPLAHPGQRFELGYREHVTEANAFAQTYQVAFGMPRPQSPLLLPGMTATVVVTPLGQARGAAPRLPMSALDSDSAGGFRVWVYAADTGAVTPRLVELGGTRKGLVEIVSGVASGEQVVAAGIEFLRPGMRVRPLGDGLQ